MARTIQHDTEYKINGIYHHTTELILDNNIQSINIEIKIKGNRSELTITRALEIFETLHPQYAVTEIEEYHRGVADNGDTLIGWFYARTISHPIKNTAAQYPINYRPYTSKSCIIPVNKA